MKKTIRDHRVVDAGRLRPVQLPMRVSKEEKAIIKSHAEKSGMSLSTYIRVTSLAAGPISISDEQ